MFEYGAFAKRDGVETVLPSSAITTQRNPAGSWSWSAYAEITSGESFEFVLTGIQVLVIGNPKGSAVITHVLNQLEIATGAAGAEVTIEAAGLGWIGFIVTADSNLVSTSTSFPISPKVIPASTRLSVRATQNVAITGSGGSATEMYFTLVGYTQKLPKLYPIYSNSSRLKGLYNGISKVAPVASSTSVTADSPAGTYGAWVQFIAAADSDLLIWGVAAIKQFGASASSVIFQIGTGAAGLEIVRGAIPIPRRSAVGSGWSQTNIPIFVKTGERVALRATGGVDHVMDVNLYYEELPA